MNTDKLQSLKASMEVSFVDSHAICSEKYNSQYKSDLIYNDYKTGSKVLCSIIDELNECDEFLFSVAFITMSGITPLLQVLKDLENRGVKGKIITTDYLDFSEPRALEKLSEFKNIELKIYCSHDSNIGFHTKGYIFKNDQMYRIIVGSANMTQNAMTKNKEWNSSIKSNIDGQYTQTVLSEFYSLWNDENSFACDQVIEKYRLKYNLIKKQKKIAREKEIPSLSDYKLYPNSMQLDFINNIKELVLQNEKRALLISATGTGKTYASAFALRELNPKRILFIVHREQIAKQAMETYKRVFSHTKTMGILSGNEKCMGEDFIFSTMQTMSKEYIHSQFSKDEFDIIVIDEVHRAGAASYEKIMEYFTTNTLWLGMTASPDRGDGYDIYKLFDNNIAHEIRLQEALEEDLLCPFHYFGITDIEVEDGITSSVQETRSNIIDSDFKSGLVLAAEGRSIYSTKENDKSDLKKFANLVYDKKLEYIVEKIEFFGYSGDRVKGLVFCSSKEEARLLSDGFNKRGYKTVALTGEDIIDYRLECIDRLVGNNSYDYLDYIFTVDIFNEGVDIPEVNQVVMLRPTESSIIFIQQLGRGLRKSEGKEYVVIIDFIGNYTTNFLIPIALFGDRTFNKDNIRKYMRQGNKLLPGCSTISFDEISKERIYRSIDNANFSEIKKIKESYIQLKNKLGKIPAMMDFEKYGSMDIQCIIDNKSLGSYYGFLKKYEKEYMYRFNKDKELMIKFISDKFVNGKRIHELLIIKDILNGEDSLLERLKITLSERGIGFDSNTKLNIYNILTDNFATGSNKKTYQGCKILASKDYKYEDYDYEVSESFEKMLEDNEFRRIITELVDYGIYKNENYYRPKYEDTNFKLYSKYTYSDVCRLLEWDKDEVALNIGGYKYDKKTKTYPVFINYNKSDDISDTINYEDRFESNIRLIAISKSGRTKDSEDVQNALKSVERGIKMHLFVRKNKDDKTSKEFYYLGKIRALGIEKEFVMPNTNKTAVEIIYKLNTPVRNDIYDYITK